MRSIYDLPGTITGDVEKGRINDNIESKFITALTEIISVRLHVNQDDRKIVESLLFEILEDHLDNRMSPGLLQQYLAHELEEIANSMRRKLKIPEGIKVNHNFCTHSKFNDITEYILRNYCDTSEIFKQLNQEFPRDSNVGEQCENEECGEAIIN